MSAPEPRVRPWLSSAVDRWTAICCLERSPQQREQDRSSGGGALVGMIELGLHVLRIAAHLIGLAVLCLAFAVSAAVDLATHRGRVKDAELHPEPEQASR